MADMWVWKWPDKYQHLTKFEPYLPEHIWQGLDRG